MTDLHRLYKAIRDYFDDTPVEELSYLNFLETFKPVIMSKLDVPKQEDKGTWRKRFVTHLDKIAEDDTLPHLQMLSGTILKKKKKGYVENERYTQQYKNRARTEKVKEILSSLKRKPETKCSVLPVEGKEEYKEDENYSDDTDEDDANRMPKKKKKQFRKIFQRIPTEAKLVLNSKTVVKNILFKYAKDLDYERIACLKAESP
ncbi:hypothetical protein C1645_834485 [Glomus cerebriforme]|uniref:Uncharacterized protein n=1 Tax=Glomus cerebriforme TaxID=658196 RepID=A0A397SK99_9GLOM|nr:hypothetical protein C1645_834485 [Glomus cerebriforme]